MGDEVFADPERFKNLFHTRKIEGMAFLALPERAQLPDPVHALLARSVFVGLGVRLTQPLVHCCSNNQYMTAMVAAEIRTPQYLRQLVIQSLVNLVIDETVSAGTRVQAIKALGQITEVAAFTEKRTVEHVLNPEVLKKQITETLRGMSDDVVDVDALLVEVRGGSSPSSSALKSVDI